MYFTMTDDLKEKHFINFPPPVELKIRQMNLKWRNKFVVFVLGKNEKDGVADADDVPWEFPQIFTWLWRRYWKYHGRHHFLGLIIKILSLRNLFVVDKFSSSICISKLHQGRVSSFENPPKHLCANSSWFHSKS